MHFKNIVALSCGLLIFTACSNSSSSKTSTANPAGEGDEFTEPTPNGMARTLFTNSWKVTYDFGYGIMTFTPNTIKATQYCNNGLTASASAPARNTSSTIEALTDDSERAEMGADYCTANITATGPQAYTIRGDQLCKTGTNKCLVAYGPFLGDTNSILFAK